MVEEIDSRFRSNLLRVRALVAVYRERTGAGTGRRSVVTTDLLRCAVVFLHATMEDMLRSVLAWRWPEVASREQLEDVPFAVASSAQRHRITLADLVAHRGTTVDDLIRSSLDTYLERSNFNNLGEVKTALARSGLDVQSVLPYGRPLASLMSRRHQIVHRADLHDERGTGHHAAASLSHATVARWIAAVERLGGDVLAALRGVGHAG